MAHTWQKIVKCIRLHKELVGSTLIGELLVSPLCHALLNRRTWSFKLTLFAWRAAPINTLHTCMYTHYQTYAKTNVHTHTQHTHTNIYTHTHKHLHTHTHTRTHTHTTLWTRALSLQRIFSQRSRLLYRSGKCQKRLHVYCRKRCIHGTLAARAIYGVCMQFWPTLASYLLPQNPLPAMSTTDQK
jgi:hypothetical protein